MEDVGQHIDVKLVTYYTKHNKLNMLVAKSNVNRDVILTENFVAIHMKTTKVVYDQPIYLGMCILQFSKTLMYEFHYDYIKPKYGDRARLLMTDTDS
jgi:hypothetical protein